MQKDSKLYRILLLEDNPGDALLVQDYLEETILKPEVSLFACFEEAKQILSKDTYDLILLDLTLPDNQGLELINDILALAEAFLAKSATEEGKRFQRFDAEARAMLMRHTWPGNVRELENAIRTAVVLHDGEVVTAAMLPATVREGGAKPAPAPLPPPAPEPESVKPAPPPAPTITPRATESTKRIRPLAETEREAIEEAVRLCGGNIPKAAAFLGISPSTLYRKQESWRRR